MSAEAVWASAVADGRRKLQMLSSLVYFVLPAVAISGAGTTPQKDPAGDEAHTTTPRQLSERTTSNNDDNATPDKQETKKRDDKRVVAYVNLFTTLNTGESLKGLEKLAESALSFNATAFDVGHMLTHPPYGYTYQGPERTWWVVNASALRYVKSLDSVVSESAKPVPLTALSRLQEEAQKRQINAPGDEEIASFASSLDDAIRRPDAFFDTMHKDLQYEIIGFLDDHRENPQTFASGPYRSCANHVGENADWTVQNLMTLLGPDCASSSGSDVGGLVGKMSDLAEKFGLAGGSTNKCLDRFSVRFFKYQTSALDNLFDVIQRCLLKTLNIYGICLPMVDAQNVSVSTGRAINAIQTINKQLHKGFTDGFFDDADEEHVVDASLHAEAKISYPQSDTSNSTYRRIGGTLIDNLMYWFPQFHYHVALYYAPDGQENSCTVNLSGNSPRAKGQLEHNVRYTLTRTDKRSTLALRKAWNWIKEKKTDISKDFANSSKKNVCERINEIRGKSAFQGFSKGGFGTLVAAKCARRFVWYELAYKYYPAAWNSEWTYPVFVRESSFSSTCFTLLFVP